MLVITSPCSLYPRWFVVVEGGEMVEKIIVNEFCVGIWWLKWDGEGRVVFIWCTCLLTRQYHLCFFHRNSHIIFSKYMVYVVTLTIIDRSTFQLSR
ncbi:hypothetical protein Hanom_Chr08g00698151 [Helianthus anomalus]